MRITPVEGYYVQIKRDGSKENDQKKKKKKQKSKSKRWKQKC